MGTLYSRILYKNRTLLWKDMKNYKLFGLITCLMVVFIPILFTTPAHSQDIPAFHQKFVSFPYPMDRRWKASLGLSITTLAEDITEEQHLRVPCGEFRLLRKMSHNSYLEGRANFQGFQNLVSVGPKWAFPINDRFSMSLGDDVAFWFGFITLEGFKSTGHGFQNYPNVSLGYRLNHGILVTLKQEALMNLSFKAKTGNTPVTADYRLFSGTAFTATLEQPFYGKKSLSLGFRFIYTDFFWQTWALFPTFDRNIFYPQLLIGFIF